MPSNSFWAKTSRTHQIPTPPKSDHFDAIVIGGGMTGATTAYLMKKAGLKVALMERGRCGMVNTAHTSAHLTYVTDMRGSKLVNKLGKDHAQAVLDAGMAAIELIEKIVDEEQIDCHFAKVPGYLHASLSGTENEQDHLQKETATLRDLGVDAVYLESIPFFHRPGIRFPNQARFHPLHYLNELVSRIPGDGSAVYEKAEVTEFSAKPLQIKTSEHTFSCDYVVIATDVPLQGNNSLIDATLFQTKIAPYTSYVIGAEVPSGLIPDALFWDTSDPYYYLRLEKLEGKEYAIFGGQDHKTGQASDAVARYDQIEKILHQYSPKAQVNSRWSGQVVEAVDGLPYIGEIAEKQFVATGFSGNGLTFGTLAAIMARDAVLGRKNPWKELFDPGRKKLSSTWNYLKENADYPYYLIKDRLTKAEEESPENLSAGEGKILQLDGKRVAAYKDQAGKVSVLSPVCTHMGCIVHWNATEKTWDCPCHGSRFQASGEVLTGPAETPLEVVKTSQVK